MPLLRSLSVPYSLPRLPPPVVVHVLPELGPGPVPWLRVPATRIFGSRSVHSSPEQNMVTPPRPQPLLDSQHSPLSAQRSRPPA
ncbi:hypothetical protein CDV31_000045 [Fusarium ambrosium]|uniref:Uncharacterized protein n=1 Tax=Fusarium ambrosium TaxID=131363 RepID=A0A428V3A3_9HYPO|nr:hypothetical protein CDV31_000045 [Fusarium ambrosium]